MASKDRFEDLAGQIVHEQTRALIAEAHDLAVAEASVVRIVDRIAGAQGKIVRIGLRSGKVFEGAVREVGRDWCALEVVDSGLPVVVRCEHLAYVEGDLRKVRTAQELAPRKGFGRKCEEWSRARCTVTIAGMGLEVRSVVVRVGEDHVEMAVDGDASRGGSTAPNYTRAVPFSVIEVVHGNLLC